MDISINSNQPAFGAKFINNKAFQDVVTHAKNQKRLPELTQALNQLLIADKGDILIIHGKQEDALIPIYSSFMMYKGEIKGYLERRSVQNLAMDAKTPAEASFNALLDLASMGKKYRKLFGGEPKYNIKAEDIIKKYTIPVNV